jgi:hypothetical protein
MDTEKCLINQHPLENRFYVVDLARPQLTQLPEANKAARGWKKFINSASSFIQKRKGRVQRSN